MTEVLGGKNVVPRTTSLLPHIKQQMIWLLETIWKHKKTRDSIIGYVDEFAYHVRRHFKLVNKKTFTSLYKRWTYSKTLGVNACLLKESW